MSEAVPPPADPIDPAGPAGLAAVAQHAWEDTYPRDDRGRPVAPRVQRLVMLDVINHPTRDDADRLEHALGALEQRWPRGPHGLLMALGWGPGWFERRTESSSPVGRPLPLARWEDPELEDIDACLHLASDRPEVLDDVVALLFGPGRYDQRRCLAIREIRTGFVGAGLPAGHLDGAGISSESPLLLGFHSGLTGNQATEAEVTITRGRMTGGTTMHVSRILLDVQAWYARSADERAARMFAPSISAEQAADLVEDAKSDPELVASLAAEHGVVGHAQAAARARLDGRPRINRRDFATLDDGRPGTHFVSIQRTIADFNATRGAMNAADARHHHQAIGHRENNGINTVVEVISRANFSVPPRALRAFPLL